MLSGWAIRLFIAHVSKDPFYVALQPTNKIQQFIESGAIGTSRE